MVLTMVYEVLNKNFFMQNTGTPPTFNISVREYNNNALFL